MQFYLAGHFLGDLKLVPIEFQKFRVKDYEQTYEFSDERPKPEKNGFLYSLQYIQQIEDTHSTDKKSSNQSNIQSGFPVIKNTLVPSVKDLKYYPCFNRNLPEIVG